VISLKEYTKGTISKLKFGRKYEGRSLGCSLRTFSEIFFHPILMFRSLSKRFPETIVWYDDMFREFANDNERNNVKNILSKKLSVNTLE